MGAQLQAALLRSDAQYSKLCKVGFTHDKKGAIEYEGIWGKLQEQPEDKMRLLYDLVESNPNLGNAAIGYHCLKDQDRLHTLDCIDTTTKLIEDAKRRRTKKQLLQEMAAAKLSGATDFEDIAIQINDDLQESIEQISTRIDQLRLVLFHKQLAHKKAKLSCIRNDPTAHPAQQMLIQYDIKYLTELTSLPNWPSINNFNWCSRSNSTHRCIH